MVQERGSFPALIGGLPGRRCISILRFQHQIEGLSTSDAGAVEFAWDDGTHLTLDANADWTLDISAQQWLDPFAPVSVSQRAQLAMEVGVWERASIGADLSRLIGQVVTSTAPEFNEVGELTGLTVAFDDMSVSARVVGGKLAVETGLDPVTYVTKANGSEQCR